MERTLSAPQGDVQSGKSWSLTKGPKHIAGLPANGNSIGASSSSSALFAKGQTVRTFVLSTAKNGHVNLCIAVAELIGVDVAQVIQVPGSNKALPPWRKKLGQMRWFIPAVQMVWRCRRGEILVLASGRSILFACRLLKILRRDKVFIIYIGSPRTWTANATDVMLRADHERELGRDEGNRYHWKPKQVWVDAPICRPLPVSGGHETEVVVLVGGVNATYGDEAADYGDFLDKLETLVENHPVRIAFSRRTKPSVKAAFKHRFEQTAAKLVEAADRQGFLAACEAAGAFVVTPDSITMVAEACATGKPVYTARLPVKLDDSSNYRFIETNLKHGHAQQFDGAVNFDRRAVDRSDVEAARRDLIGYIQAWQQAQN